MSKGRDEKNVVGTTTTTSAPQDSVDRRKTLKKLGIGGALATGAKWASPVVVSMSLPAHAQTSTTTTTTIAGTTTTTIAGTTTTTLEGTTTTTTTLASTGDGSVCLANRTGCISRGVATCGGPPISLMPLLNPGTGNNSIIITITGTTPSSPILTASLDNESAIPGDSDTMTDGAGAATVVYSTGSGNGVDHKATITIDGCVFCYIWTT